MTDLSNIEIDVFHKEFRIMFGNHLLKMDHAAEDQCEGCFGDVDDSICFKLPTGCSSGNYIWIQA